MLKALDSMKSVQRRAAGELRQLLEQVPVIDVLDIEHQMQKSDHGIDLLARVKVSGRQHALVCGVGASGQPRHVRVALLQLRDYVANQAKDATPIFIAPYLSPEAQALCREQGVGYLDMEGNARVSFGSVFIERQVASKPAVERRELRSLFKPKSAQVLRVLLRDPQRAWRVTELAQAADVSLGHVSNVRVGLVDREWAQVSTAGLYLSEPGVLLDEWRGAYEPPAGERLSFYTTLHGSAFEEAARQALGSQRETATGLAAFASFSAAQWLAPYGRTGMQYFYADEAGLERLRDALKLSSTAKGENVVVDLLTTDLGVFRDAIEPAPGMICTSPVQTYLDLACAGERGQEAAAHLRQERLAWQI